MGPHGLFMKSLQSASTPATSIFAIGVEGNTKICYLNLKTTVERPKASYRSRNLVLFSELRKSQKFI